MSARRPTEESSKYSFRQRHHSNRSGQSSADVSQDASEATFQEESGDDQDEEIEQLLKSDLGWKIILYLPYDPVWSMFVSLIMIIDIALISIYLTQEYINEVESGKAYGTLRRLSR